MGDVAQPARLLALRERNGFAYAPVDNATAPGQISLDEMKRLYRADKLNRATRVYGVIGDPIGHSLSPAMQNAGVPGAEDERGLCAVSGARSAGFSWGYRAAGDSRFQRDDCRTRKRFCGISTAAIRWRTRSAR